MGNHGFRYRYTIRKNKFGLLQGLFAGNRSGRFSQKVMGKTFRNRGPYEEFLFIPTYMMPAKAVRFFHVKEEHKKQLLFMSVRKFDRNQENVIKTLKVMGDGTRYQILALLARMTDIILSFFEL